MSEETVRGGGLERAMPLAGVAFLALGVLGTLLTPGGDPGFVARPGEIARYYDAHADGVLASQAIYLFSGVFLLWFVAALRRALAGRGEALAQAVMAGAVSGTALMIGGASVAAAAALRVQERGAIDPQLAAAMHDISQIMYGLAAPMAWAAAVLALAAVALRSDVVPRWIGQVSIPLGLALAIPPINHVVINLLGLWTLAVGVALYLRALRPAVTAAAEGRA